ncbi:hypothetical protein L2E82_21506 [Cichorium intybus]|uniref:Uncharacterized protein n=1 Tax=Cichorium intybus TaxID=13427 RepID=A0ACB9DVM0_CICIN|nr:hypothetical protein L2E82_21506 [Cichorium intybus]
MEKERQKLEVAESNPKKVKSVNITLDYSAQRLASPFPQNPKKTDPTDKKVANEIHDTHCDVKYEMRTKYKNESRGSRVLLYLEGLRFDGVDVERGRPSICCWNASTMRLCEDLEMASGGFGMGVIRDIVGREETQEE